MDEFITVVRNELGMKLALIIHSSHNNSQYRCIVRDDGGFMESEEISIGVESMLQYSSENDILKTLLTLSL